MYCQTLRKRCWSQHHAECQRRKINKAASTRISRPLVIQFITCDQTSSATNHGILPTFVSLLWVRYDCAYCQRDAFSRQGNCSAHVPPLTPTPNRTRVRKREVMATMRLSSYDMRFPLAICRSAYSLPQSRDVPCLEPVKCLEMPFLICTIFVHPQLYPLIFTAPSTSLPK
jgi:hypothetical protein